MDNIADLIVEVLLAEGFELEQIEEFIESEEFDVFTDALLEEIAEEEFLEEGILKTIGKKLPGRAHRMARDAYGKAKKFYASSISDSKKSMSSSDKAEKKALYKSGHNKFLVGKSLSRKARKLDWQGKAPFKNYMKGIKEESENLDEGKSRLVRLGKAIGDELGIRKPRPDEKLWGVTRGKNFRNTAGHLAAQATMGGAAGAAWYGGSGKAAAVGAGIATAGGLALQVRDRYKYLKNIGEDTELDEGVLRTIDKALGSPLQKRRIKKKLDTAGYKLLGKDNEKYTGSEEQQDRMRTLVKRHPTYMKWKKQGHSNGTIFLRKEDFEGIDTEGLTEELLMEIKMKLKPGQKMTPKQFAKMKAEVLAKQKEDKAKKEAKKAAPKQEKKDEKVDTDDTNRNARILKGQFPWGNVSQTLANSALAKLKQIPKPEDRLNAMDAIWDHSKHFHDLIRNGKVDYKKEKEKGKITLPKVKGVTE